MKILNYRADILLIDPRPFVCDAQNDKGKQEKKRSFKVDDHWTQSDSQPNTDSHRPP